MTNAEILKCITVFSIETLLQNHVCNGLDIYEGWKTFDFKQSAIRRADFQVAQQMTTNTEIQRFHKMDPCLMRYQLLH